MSSESHVEQPHAAQPQVDESKASGMFDTLLQLITKNQQQLKEKDEMIRKLQHQLEEQTKKLKKLECFGELSDEKQKEMRESKRPSVYLLELMFHFMENESYARFVDMYADDFLTALFQLNPETLPVVIFYKPNNYEKHGQEHCSKLLAYAFKKLKEEPNDANYTHIEKLFGHIMKYVLTDFITTEILPHVMEDERLARIVYATYLSATRENSTDMDLKDLLRKFPSLIFENFRTINENLMRIAIESPYLNTVPLCYLSNDFENPELFQELVKKRPELIVLNSGFSDRVTAHLAFELRNKSREILEYMHDDDANWLMSIYFPEEYQEVTKKELENITKETAKIISPNQAN